MNVLRKNLLSAEIHIEGITIVFSEPMQCMCYPDKVTVQQISPISSVMRQSVCSGIF